MRARPSGTRSGAHGIVSGSTKRRLLAHTTPIQGTCLKSCTATRLLTFRSTAAGPASESATGALAGRHVLEARRPPARADRLGELRRQAFPLEVPGQRLVIVADRHELHLELRPGGDHRVPDARAAVVLGASDRS